MDEFGSWADRCTLNCGSCLWGIPIRIHYTYFILWIVEVILAAVRYHLFQYTMIVLVLYGPVLLVTLIIHEFGHALMNRRFGGSVDHILIWPLGGFAIIGPTAGNVMEDFWVAFAGPLTHVPQIVFWIVMFALFSEFDFAEFDFKIRFFELDGGGAGPFFKVLSMQAIELNLLLIIFNLFIPAYPLDGGRCLAALLVHFGVAVPKAAVITAITAMVAAVVLIVYGFYAIIVNGQGTGFFFILIALFILFSSVNLFRMAKNGRVYEHPLFDRPCYRQRDGAQGSNNNYNNNNGSSTTKKKKMVKKKKPVIVDNDEEEYDIETPPLESALEPKVTKKSSTKKTSVKAAQPPPPVEPSRKSTTKPTTTAATTRQVSSKAAPPPTNNEAKQSSTTKKKSSSVKKDKPAAAAADSVKQSTTTKKSGKKGEPTKEKSEKSETKKSKKASSTKADSSKSDNNNDNIKTSKKEVKPVTRATNVNETEQIENKFDDIKKRFENRKAGIYEP